MMKSVGIACMRGIFVVLLLVSEAGAQSPHNNGSQADRHTPKPGVARTESGEEIGSVIDFVVDLSTGRILLAAVSPATTQGKTTPVLLLPWSLAQVDSTGSVFDFNIATGTLRGAPCLSAEEWKQRPAPQWLTTVEMYWHTRVTPFVAPRSAMTLGRATALIGMRVQGAGNTPLGTIRELVFDPRDSTIAEVVLAVSTGSPGQYSLEFISVPWEQLYIQPQRNMLIAVSGRKVLT